MSGKLFSLYTRKNKAGKKIYYCRFKQPDGTFSPGRSTGEASRVRAEAWAQQYLQDNQQYYKDTITLQEIGQDFFNYEGPWARSKRITGKRLSEKWCMQRQGLVDRYLLPAMGKAKLRDITKPVIDDFRNTLFYERKLAGSTVNHILVSLRLILLYAEERGNIRATPTVETIRGDAAKPKKEKGILSVEEVQQLFFATSWPDYSAYVFNLTACLTGIRKGELLAIQLKNIKPGYIEIQKTWDTELSRLTKTTKNGKPRNIFITNKIQALIARLVSLNPYGEPDSFLFYSVMLPDRPVDNKVMVKAFYNALEKIGIDEATRKEKGITFHSHRHFANSFMINARLPLQKIQATTGHLTDRMTELYYHVTSEGMEDVTQLQDSLFLPDMTIISDQEKGGDHEIH